MTSTPKYSAPGEVDNRPRLDFGGGRYLRHVMDLSYEEITLDGQHVAYVKAEDVIYESTLEAEFSKQRVRHKI